MKLRQDLSAPGLLRTARTYFENKVTDHRSKPKSDFTMTDTLMSATAMFSLKYPSLLQFDPDARTDDVIRHNLKSLYHVAQSSLRHSATRNSRPR